MEPDKNINVSYDSKLTRLAPGAAWPVTLTEAIAAGSIDLGLTEQSSGEAFSKSITEEVRKAHQKGQTVRRFVTDGEQTLAATCLENRPAVRSLYYGSEEVNGHITSTNKTIKAVFVYDSWDEEYDRAIRYVFRASVTPNGDITYTDTELVMYPLLFTVIGNVEMYFTPEPVAPVTP